MNKFYNSKNSWMYHLILITSIYLILCLYQINSIPGEWFGDISIVNSYVISIINGYRPFQLVTSVGPLYFYLISPFIKFFGISYLNYKLISIAIGSLGLIVIYFFAKLVSTPRIAFYTSLATATSFWYIVWSRLGTIHMLVPLLSALLIYFFIEYLNSNKKVYFIACIITSSLGLFLYAGTFHLPILLLILLTYGSIKSKKINKKTIIITIFLLLPIIFFFLLKIQNSIVNKTDYLTIKLLNSLHGSLEDNFSQFIINFFKTITMLHYKGDIVFRWNISKAPHLDIISGVLFLVGLYSFYKKNHYSAYIIISIFFLIIPSILPGHPAVEIPSSPRTMMIVPFIFLITGYGIEDFYLLITKRFGKFKGYLFLTILFGLIFCINFFKYFVLYPKGLPNSNTPYGKIIGNYINSIKKDVLIYSTSFGWGDWGQPEVDSIFYSLNSSKKQLFNYSIIVNCEEVLIKKFIIIFNPSDYQKIDKFRSCFPNTVVKSHINNNQLVFITLESY